MADDKDEPLGTPEESRRADHLENVHNSLSTDNQKLWGQAQESN
jgi:hypothetical protein